MKKSMLHSLLPLLFLAITSFSTIARPTPLEMAMARTKGQAKFVIEELGTDPKTGRRLRSYVQGKVIALYDQRAKDFCGTLLYDKKKKVFAISTTDRNFNTFTIEKSELIEFFQDNPNIAVCEVPGYLSMQKKAPFFWMGGAVILGSLLLALGVAMAKSRIREIRSENGGQGVAGQLAIDTGWAVTKIILMTIIESIINNALGFRSPIVPVLGGTFYGKSDFVLPIIGGTILAGIPAAVLIKRLCFDGYRSPFEVLAATKIALSKAAAKKPANA